MTAPLPTPSLPDDILTAPMCDFLAATAARTPTPGGGSVAALTGALGCALAQMALQYTLGKKKFEPFRAELEAALAQLQKAATLLTELIAEDIAAYQAIGPFLKLPPDQRLADPGYLPAVAAAIGVPQSMGGLGLHILELCHDLRTRINPFLLSDLAVAAALAHATVHAAELNVLANINLVPDKPEAAHLRQDMQALSAKADTLYAQVRQFVCAQL